jgi:hypothetical protein
MSDLSELARKFPDSLVKQKPGKFAAAYVEHSVIVQRLLEVVGRSTSRWTSRSRTRTVWCPAALPRWSAGSTGTTSPSQRWGTWSIPVRTTART